MVKNTRTVFYLLPLIIILIASSCNKKDKIDTSPSVRLSFSADTVLFDTVFTTIGSVTQRLLVYNTNNSKIRISSINLAGGASSPYKLNIDGIPENSAGDVEIEAHDSLYILVRITIDPGNQDLPFIVSDSIVFNTNGNVQNVKLVAWGQDAYFHKDMMLKGTTVFDSLKPHVIYGTLRVDTAGSLTVQQGAKLYFHKNSGLAVSMDATLKVDGTLDHPVTFAGDRLDPYYRDLPAQWNGIDLERGSINNTINYAVIKNGNYGITIDSLPLNGNAMLTIDNTIIQNVGSSGIYAYSTKIISTNCVIGNTGGSSLALVKGGDYDFRQLTIGNYWSASVRLSPSLYISNYVYGGTGSTIPNDLTKAYFANSIIYGVMSEEMVTDSTSAAAFNYLFDHCLLQTEKPVTSPVHYSGSFSNQDPKFVDPPKWDFQLDTLSPAIGKGINVGVSFDIKGVARGSAPDLGAYQFVPR
jgi:hypothetical protein